MIRTGGLLAVALVSGVLLCLTLFGSAGGEEKGERITSFVSRVAIKEDGSLTVTETITVVAAGKQIKRGIYRDFPTRYRDRLGGRLTVPFHVRRVLRNGEEEPWHTERLGRTTRVYIGRKNVFIEPGAHTYSIEYTTDRQIGFFDDFDELNWNVTGNEWAFPIETVKAEIILPEAAPLLRSAAYTGLRGSKGGDYSTERGGGGEVIFSASRRLEPGEGLTVAVAWPKGFVAESGPGEKRRQFARDNRSLIAAAAGMILLLVYQLLAWLKVGRDPPPGVIVPLFEPPRGYSPAAARYVMKMGYSDRVFAAALVGMAVKGAITIEGEGGSYALSRSSSWKGSLTKGERKVVGALFGSGDHIALKTRNHKRIAKAVEVLKRNLHREFGKMHFKKNKGYIIPGVVIAAGTIAAAILAADMIPLALFITVWLTFWTIGCYAFMVQIFRSWRAAFRSFGGMALLRVAAAIFITVFAVPFMGGELFGLWTFSEATSPSAAALLLVLIASNIVFARVLKAPTLYGRRAMDRIEGFRKYLAAAEGDRLERMHQPEKTPELFEEYLPYAMALDVESAWTRAFEGAAAGAGKGEDYRPSWYRGSGWSGFGTTAVASGLGSSLAAAITASASPPGSRSGSGGGGSSGGGGGGGGGGGW